MKIPVQYLILIFIIAGSCKEDPSTNTASLINDSDNKSYWYNNEAEISSYQLNQARYGEIREGKSVLIFVTETFSKTSNTKADNPKGKDVPVLKLNFTKKFNTGVYPYSMMTSTFFPFKNGKHSLKVSSSSQEWCGHTYMELKNDNQFNIRIASYFEGESKEKNSIEKNYLEDDFWSMIRLNPTQLPIGKVQVIPSFFFLRLLHKEAKAYDCELSTEKIDDHTNSYKIHYPTLDRTLTVNYQAKFPHKILSWEETYYSGWGKDRKLLTTSAKLIQTIKSAYWNKHSNKDLGLRIKLGLDE